MTYLSLSPVMDNTPTVFTIVAKGKATNLTVCGSARVARLAQNPHLDIHVLVHIFTVCIFVHLPVDVFGIRDNRPCDEA